MKIKIYNLLYAEKHEGRPFFIHKETFISIEKMRQWIVSRVGKEYSLYIGCREEKIEDVFNGDFSGFLAEEYLLDLANSEVKFINE